MKKGFYDDLPANIEMQVQKALEQNHTGYSDNIGNEICVRVAHGQSLREICALEHMPSWNTLTHWLYSDFDEGTVHGERMQRFQREYAKATQAKYEIWADDIVHVADTAVDKDTAAAAKVRVNARQFIAERRLATKYAQASRVLDVEEKQSSVEQLAAALQMIQEQRNSRLGETAVAPALPSGCEVSGTTLDLEPTEEELGFSEVPVGEEDVANEVRSVDEAVGTSEEDVHDDAERARDEDVLDEAHRHAEVRQDDADGIEVRGHGQGEA